MPTDLDILDELESTGLTLKRQPTKEGFLPPISDTWFTASNRCVLDSADKVVALNLYKCGVEAIPEPVFRLRHLRSLFLWANGISEIPDAIRQLEMLEYIFLGYNRLDAFPNILLELPELKLIDLSSNRVAQIPSNVVVTHGYDMLWIDPVALTRADAIEESSNGKVLSVKENPLQQPPVDIVREGPAAVRTYFEQVKQAKGQTENLFEAKLLIIGDGGTGKTSFNRKIRNAAADMPADADTTLGIEVDKWSFPIQHGSDEVLFHVNLWDFGGQKIYRGTHQIFFSEKSYYVLVADTREQGTDFSYWLNTVHQLAGDDSAVLILLNKKYGHEIKFDERGFRGHFGGLIKEVVELDLKNDTARVRDLQETAKRHLKQLPGIGDPLPPSWVSIRSDLLNETSHFISFDRFREICSDHQITDANVIHTLSGYFGRIGAITHYIDDPVLQDRVYLNSNWLVNTVYEVLDNDRVKSQKGRLNDADIEAIWATDDLLFEKNKLAQLMHKFGLMYHVSDSNSYVVPEHLPTDQPYKEWEHAGAADILHFIYEFDKFMPTGLMSRLIVSLHHHIGDHKRVWHRGLNVELRGTYGEVIETYGSTNTFRIRITGTNKIELLAVIRERFSEVLEPFRNLNYKQLVPCTCDECAIAAKPAFHDYDKLLNLRAKGTGSQCSETGKLVDVNELLKITEFVAMDDDEADADEAVDQSALKTVKLFLASSSELEKDRREVEIWVRRENKKLVKRGLYLDLDLWEDFVDAMSKTRLQDEYNKVVAQCDIFVSLFATKVGKYTAEEFEVAYANFQSNGKPEYVYTFFKEVQVKVSDPNVLEDLTSLRDFKEKLHALGHFPTPYTSSEDLTGQLRNQLDKITQDTL